MVRHNSWAEEVEATLGAGDATEEVDDMNQWLGRRREPSRWAERLNDDVRGAADNVGNFARKIGRQEDRKTGQYEAGSRPSAEKPHNCMKDNARSIHHWFGTSSNDESEDRDDDEWKTVGREQRNESRKRRRRERNEKMKLDLTMKARRMAGLGPISSQDVEKQRKKTKDYNVAKVWAVKAHLASQYKYNQEELDALDILETKCNSKDDIIYIATASERDIKDIYSRKAECRSDDTTVKSFIPPQYWERFSALNRLCAHRRSQDSSLKTQIRFGERDLIVLTKEKGSQEPYSVTDAATFAEGEEIPDIDMAIKWRFQEERPPRRRLTSVDRPATGQPLGTETYTGQVTRQLSRQEDSEDSRRKKMKRSDPAAAAANPDSPSVQNNEVNMNITQ